jgi:TPR repeat protein
LKKTDRSGTIIPATRFLTRSGRRSSVTLILLAIALAALAGCQAAPPADYRTLTERVAAGEEVSAEELRDSFLAAEDYPVRMERLADLEAQAFAIVEDEPLKLGSLGTAILDTYYGSLTGHYVLARFYRHLDNPEAALPHEAWIERIQQSMLDSAREGAGDTYLKAVTATEAQVFVLSRGMTPVGSIYQTISAVPFALMVQAAPASGPLQAVGFDLTSVYEGMRAAFGAAEGDAEFTPLNLVGFLAKEGDTAAQTAVGAFLATQGRLEDATNWLRAASRTGNLIANSLLARIFWEQARETEDPEMRKQYLDEALENYLHAVALGSSDAMYALGVLYLNGHFGEENVVAGIPLLKQAAEQDHSDAIMFLAHLHYAGEGVDKDLDAARAYYVRAAELGNAFARRSYARFLLDRSTAQAGDPRAVAWLEELADADDAEAMLLLGNLTARGIGTRASTRGAVRWYQRAVSTAPLEASIVNEVAWTLAVSDQQDLRRAEFARQIMDKLMNANPEARARPEYLDTWAATYAAIGDFERAAELQEEAIKAAASGEFTDVEEVLRKHLEIFRAGGTVSEAVP